MGYLFGMKDHKSYVVNFVVNLHTKELLTSGCFEYLDSVFLRKEILIKMLSIRFNKGGSNREQLEYYVIEVEIYLSNFH